MHPMCIELYNLYIMTNKDFNAKNANWLTKESITELAMSIAEVATLRYAFHNDDNTCIETSVNLQENLRIAQNEMYHFSHKCKCRMVYDYNNPF